MPRPGLCEGPVRPTALEQAACAHRCSVPASARPTPGKRNRSPAQAEEGHDLPSDGRVPHSAPFQRRGGGRRGAVRALPRFSCLT